MVSAIFQKEPIMKTKNGFTLIEIMVVIVIMGVLAAVGVPKLFGVIAKAKTAELLSAAGTYIHLEDAYLHQGRGVGSWKDIGYAAPGNGKTNYFEYGNCLQDESSGESGNSFIGWHATNLSSLNECSTNNAWAIVITPADQNIAYYSQIASAAECASFSSYWEVGNINISACTAASTQTAQQNPSDSQGSGNTQESSNQTSGDDSSNGCTTSNGQGAGLQHAWGQQKKCNPDAVKPGNGNGNGNGNGKGNGKN
jgi:prepilin-type N-terminal cleavage/methylation domain-containing protein